MIQRFLRRLSTPDSDRPHMVAQEAVETCERELRTYERRYTLLAPKVSQWYPLGRILRSETYERGIRLVAANGRAELTWLDTECLHVRLVHPDRPPLLGLPPLQFDTAPPPAFELSESADWIEMATAGAVCRIQREHSPMTLSLPDAPPLYTELHGMSWQTSRRGRLSIALNPATAYHGLGARHDNIDARSRRWPLWVPPERGSGSAPVLLGVGTNGAFALLWLNPARGTADIGASRSDEIVFEAEDDRIEYLICIAPTPLAALGRCALRFGPLLLPPLWALGYQHSADDDASAAIVGELAAEFRRRAVPCDAIHLGLSYLDAARPFTIDVERFPTLRELINDLHGLGFQIVAAQHPAIKADETYPPFLTGARRHTFIRYPDGTLVRAAGHPGTSVFPDFARDDVRQWWSEQMAALVRAGIDGIENRAASPDIQRHGAVATLPDAAQHGGESPQSHAIMHNLYANGMAAASRDAFDQYGSALRHLLLLPTGWSGATQYGFPWIANQSCDWETLRSIMRAVLNASASALPYIGIDLPPCANGEMQTRWLQAAALLPGLRSPAGGDTPWAFGQPYELINRLTLELRYRLLPYLYSCLALAREYGVPVIRPLWLSAPELRGVDDAYLVGDHLLAAPVMTPGTRERTLHLPAGLWYDFWSSEAYVGEREVVVPAPLERLPLFVRGGTSLPLWDVQQYIHQHTPERQVLRIYPGSAETTLYEDHGEGLAYAHGDYRWVYYSCAWDRDARFSVSRRKAGTFVPPTLKSQIEIVGLPSEPLEVRLDRQGAPIWYFDDGTLELIADDDFARIEIDFVTDSETPTRRRGDL